MHHSLRAIAYAWPRAFDAPAAPLHTRQAVYGWPAENLRVSPIFIGLLGHIMFCATKATTSAAPPMAVSMPAPHHRCRQDARTTTFSGSQQTLDECGIAVFIRPVYGFESVGYRRAKLPADFFEFFLHGFGGIGFKV